MNNATATNFAPHSNPTICRYFLRGICRFGPMCRFSHDIGNNTEIAGVSDLDLTTSTTDAQSSSTSRRNWANAPVFVPHRPNNYASTPNNDDLVTVMSNFKLDNDMDGNPNDKSWAEIVGGGGETRLNLLAAAAPGSLELVCPYEPPCPYGNYCLYTLHFELCEMCNQYCLHPTDEAKRRQHKRECLQQHEQAMELSFAIARSKDKTCGICFDTVMEKSGHEKRFGILPNCCHIFCLECIRKWRKTKFEHNVTRSCPECRVASDFICPSAFWVETKEEKEKLLSDYRSALCAKDCKYFKKGHGKCPFGNRCFYKHALASGELVDVGRPKRARKMHRSSNEIIDLLDIYLWEFIDHRDYHWLDLLSSTDSEDSDWSDE